MTAFGIGAGILAVNAISFGAARRQRPGIAADAPKPDGAQDPAWAVLEAANDLGDVVTVEICRRVIDANLSGRPASPSDMHIILDYFG
jgi:hypothetical protein